MADPILHMRHAAQHNPALNEDIARICSIVLDNPYFAVCTGSVSANKHHFGKGGLALHTREVMLLCMRNAQAFGAWGYKINKQVLFTSAVWHDYGKIWDYAPILYSKEDVITEATGWQETPHKRRVNHLCRSAVEWTRAVTMLDICHDIHDEVLHCILAHHGDYGSPVFPKSREAWILHLSDNMSARVNDCDFLDLSERK